MFLNPEPHKQLPDSCSLSWHLLLEEVCPESGAQDSVGRGNVCPGTASLPLTLPSSHSLLPSLLEQGLVRIWVRLLGPELARRILTAHFLRVARAQGVGDH